LKINVVNFVVKFYTVAKILQIYHVGILIGATLYYYV